ncbi:MAG: dihydroneopterin aldolase [Bacillota bacterium]|jgi:dihydroneopterin aldolase
MDKIYLDQLEFFAYHGVFDHEKRDGQTFFVSAVLELDLTAAGESDDLETTVNYGEVYDLIADVTLNRRFDLIEKLALTLIEELLAAFPPLTAVTIRVDKPKAPGTTCKFPAAVELRRERK